MVEMAFAVPLLLLSLFAIIYFGRAFYISQSLVFAAQEGARVAARVPNLRDPGVRDWLRGFTVSGQSVNEDSVVYSCLSASRLLTAGATGNLPQGCRVKILPWDGDGSQADYTPPGTVAVKIEYPYQLLGGSPSGGSSPELAVAMSADGEGAPVTFANFVLAERATVSQEVYQEVN